MARGRRPERCGHRHAGFLAENRDSVGTTFDKLAEITQALGESSADLKQTLHVAPTGLSNFINIYEPANAR